MTDDKKCKVCGSTESKKWIERQNIAGIKAYFCSPKCFQEYKKKAALTGICEFC